jgi:hypothetical protein
VSLQGTLNRIAESSDGAQAVVDRLLSSLLPGQIWFFGLRPKLEHQYSPDPDVREWTTEIFVVLGRDELSGNLVLKSNLSTQLMSLWRQVKLPMLKP